MKATRARIVLDNDWTPETQGERPSPAARRQHDTRDTSSDHAARVEAATFLALAIGLAFVRPVATNTED